MSFAGAALCVLAGVVLVAGAPLVVAAVLFPLGSSCDLADGMIARGSVRRNPAVGAFIDSICDKIGETALTIGLFVAFDDFTVDLLLLLAYGLGALTSYTKAFAGEHRLDIEWPEARRFGRAGRVVLLSLTLAVSTAVASQHEQSTMIAGLATLVCFNLGTFGWRLARVVREVR